MGDGGVGESDGPGGVGAVAGLEGLGEFGGISTGATDLYGGYESQNPFPGGRQEGSANQDTPVKPKKTEKVAEKKEGVKRKARKRSLLSDEETTVYRRSILGS